MLLISAVLFLNNGDLLSSPVNDKDTISKKMQEKIFQSSFKALLHRGDGKKIMAYLYANNEKSELTECNSRDGSSYTTIAKIGHFQIYLYDVDQAIFLPIITPIFKYLNETSFNVEGAKIIVLPSMQEGKSDVLLISQFATFEGDAYEAYGFSQDNLSFKQYIFNNKQKKKKEDEFYGSIAKDKDKNKLIAYATRQMQIIGGFEILTMDIFVSKTQGEIELTDTESYKK